MSGIHFSFAPAHTDHDDHNFTTACGLPIRSWLDVYLLSKYADPKDVLFLLRGSDAYPRCQECVKIALAEMDPLDILAGTDL